MTLGVNRQDLVVGKNVSAREGLTIPLIKIIQIYITKKCHQQKHAAGQNTDEHRLELELKVNRLHCNHLIKGCSKLTSSTYHYNHNHIEP